MHDTYRHPHLKSALDLASEFSSYMLASGASTLRVIRCTTRLINSLGIDIEMTTTFKHVTLSVRDRHDGYCTTRVVSVPEMPPSFERTSDLSVLSWQAHDNVLTLDELWRRFKHIVSRPRWNPLVVLFLISIANACFCRLFDGDFVAMAFVFGATLIGFGLKQILTRHHVNNYIILTTCAFFASISASIALKYNCTAQIAIATSPLFLVPGVPLINGIIDIVEGHILVGISRLINAMLTILCIAIGLSATLMIVKGSLI